MFLESEFLVVLSSVKKREWTKVKSSYIESQELDGEKWKIICEEIKKSNIERGEKYKLSLVKNVIKSVTVYIDGRNKCSIVAV